MADLFGPYLVRGEIPKRAIKPSIHDHQIRPTEFLTLCTENSNILNQRPLGTTYQLPKFSTSVGRSPGIEVDGNSSENPRLEYS